AWNTTFDNISTGPGEPNYFLHLCWASCVLMIFVASERWKLNALPAADLLPLNLPVSHAASKFFIRLATSALKVPFGRPRPGPFDFFTGASGCSPCPSSACFGITACCSCRSSSNLSTAFFMRVRYPANRFLLLSISFALPTLPSGAPSLLVDG